VPPRTSARTIALLFSLYFVQGLPFGFQAKALSVYLRLHGVSLTAIGFAQALALPWMCKALWAPLVDRYGSTRFGRRKSWIVPLQLLLALTCGFAALFRPEDGLSALLGLVFLMNLLAATQDIAVDALAIDLLPQDELGPANAAQVVGFKAGMLVSGGLLLGVSDRIGFQGYFGAMAALVLIILLIAVLPLREPAPSAAPGSLVDVVAIAARALRVPGALWLLLFIGTYKIGESMVDAMFKPFLVDAGFSAPQIGLWIGTYGLAASIAGSLAGGFLAKRKSLLGALTTTAVLRSISVLGVWLLATMAQPTASAIIGVTIAEHFFGGALTTAMFAFMMSRIDKSIGATHYTVLASVEVFGKAPGGWLSGLFAEGLGYCRLFALGAALSFAFLPLLWLMRSRPPPNHPSD
jgi:predicted MFS family arabinose efflux permease